MRKAIIKNKVTGAEVEVHATTEHSASNYGKSVWVDENNNAYMQTDLPKHAQNPFYTIIREWEE